MKTIRVVAAVIKAANESGEPIIFATHQTVQPKKGKYRRSCTALPYILLLCSILIYSD